MPKQQIDTNRLVSRVEDERISESKGKEQEGMKSGDDEGKREGTRKDAGTMADG